MMQTDAFRKWQRKMFLLTLVAVAALFSWDKATGGCNTPAGEEYDVEWDTPATLSATVLCQGDTLTMSGTYKYTGARAGDPGGNVNWKIDGNPVASPYDTSALSADTHTATGYYSETDSFGNICSVPDANIDFTIIKVDLEAKFKIVENETAMSEVTEGGDTFYRTLGGMRVHLDATVTGATPTEYEWSTTSDGKYFGSYAQNAAQLTGPALEGAALNEIYWQGDPERDLDETITLKLTFAGGGTVTKTWNVRSRLLKLESPHQTGDDVKMLQSFLRVVGVSQGSTPGVQGTAVVADADFGSGTDKAAKRLQERDELTPIDGKVGNDTLGKIEKHWNDYLAAFDAFPSSTKINNSHSSFAGWITAGASELATTYTDPIQQSVDPNTSREEILTAWVNKETGTFGHWGYNVNYRVTLGSADEYGSIGFSQIQNRYKYGASPNAAFNSLNLYHPEHAIRAFAVFSNKDTIPGGGGFKKAFVAPQPYKVTKNYAAGIYPRLGNAYTDDNKDLLSKGVMAYNRGPNYAGFTSKPWPELLKDFDPPLPATPFGTRTAIKYALTIQSNAGVPLKTWTWTDKSKITTGADGLANTTKAGDDIQVIAVGQGESDQPCITPGGNGVLNTTPGGDDAIDGTQIQTGNNGVCETTKSGDDVQLIPVGNGKPNSVAITPGSDDTLNSTPAGDDQNPELQFDYGEQEWLNGKTWPQKRDE